MFLASATELVVFDIKNIIWLLWLIAPLGAAFALVFAYIFFTSVIKSDPGNQRMQQIARAVRKGAFAYLLQQYKVVAITFVILIILLSIISFVFKTQSPFVPFAFLTGGFFSGLCGFLGMNTSTLASSRTAQACRSNLNRGLTLALRGGAVMGLVVVGFALIDICAWLYVLTTIFHLPLREVTVTMLAFGMGASTQALFARVGGGIYTKASDVGADLVGKVEAGIPEDDPRNAAVIADNVGDNVGDVAGMGADLYESYCGSTLSTAALGFALAATLWQNQYNSDVSGADALPWVVLPMVIAGIGNIASVIGIYIVRTKEDVSLKNLMDSLFNGIYVSSGIVIVFSLLFAWLFLNNSKCLEAEGYGLFGIKPTIWGIWGSIVAGLLAGLVIGKATDIFTSNAYAPTRNLAEQATTGPATVIIQGVALGMLSTLIPILSVVVAIVISFAITGGFAEPIRGLYGISIAAVGMLSTLGITLATDAYGPIADNAGGNAQMSALEPEVRERTDALDALGNSTAAIGKGFAIGSAALTALALLAAYVEEIRIGVIRIAAKGYQNAPQVSAKVIDHDGKPVEGEIRAISEKLYAKLKGETANPDVRHVEAYLVMGGSEEKKVVPVSKAKLMDFMNYYAVNLMNPNVLCGIFLGAMAVFFFCALTMKAVGRAAKGMVEEVRRQWKEIPGVMEGTAEPDYARCVRIATQGAQKEMILPALSAIIIPLVAGLVFGVEGVMGLLIGALSCGFAVAIMMASAGGAWDNAKKWIEKGYHGGKGSLPHKAAVVGDTVGDPFKDTSGPSLNILIKLMSMVSIVFVGVVLEFHPYIAQLIK